MDNFHATLMNSKDGVSLVGFWKCHAHLLKVLVESGETIDRALCTSQNSLFVSSRFAIPLQCYL